MNPSALDAVGPAFRAIAEGVVPELVEAPPAVWSALRATIDAALAGRPPHLTRQLIAFIRLIGVASWCRFGRPFTRLTPDQRTALLRGLERCPFLVFRRGIWGLRTLVFMGYYTQPNVIASLGYRASPAGWAR